MAKIRKADKEKDEVEVLAQKLKKSPLGKFVNFEVERFSSGYPYHIKCSYKEHLPKDHGYSEYKFLTKATGNGLEISNGHGHGYDNLIHLGHEEGENVQYISEKLDSLDIPGALNELRESFKKQQNAKISKAEEVLKTLENTRSKTIKTIDDAIIKAGGKVKNGDDEKSWLNRTQKTGKNTGVERSKNS